MSSFSYGKHTKKHIGIWLKYEVNNDIKSLIKTSKQKRFFDTVQRVIVSEYDKHTDTVGLQVWCSNLLDVMMGKVRYNVFYISSKVNENWSCHGSIGKGIKFK